MPSKKGYFLLQNIIMLCKITQKKRNGEARFSWQKNLLQISPRIIEKFIPTTHQGRFMVYDFSNSCKSYEANFYKRSDFVTTSCPKCYAFGRFKLHGSYSRHVLYFDELKLVHWYMEIKRIMCLSCRATHAVMPGDIIPYKLLSLFVLLLILRLALLARKPVLRIADRWGFSFQFIYLVLAIWGIFVFRVFLFFKELSGGELSASLDATEILPLIQKPYFKFQSNYIKMNKRPCFMCKFLNGTNAPAVGQIPLQLLPGE